LVGRGRHLTRSDYQKKRKSAEKHFKSVPLRACSGTVQRGEDYTIDSSRALPSREFEENRNTIFLGGRNTESREKNVTNRIRCSAAGDQN